MGLRRRLSKKWNETVNGVLSGPGVDVDSVNTGTLNGAEFATQKSGADADARLDAAIAASSEDGLVVLETGADYTRGRTVNASDVAEITTLANRGATISATWTIDGAGLRISGLDLGPGGQFVMSGIASSLYDIYNSGSTETILVQNDYVRIADCYNLTIEFESGTSGGVADTLTNSSVTDNGANQIGDVL